MMLELENLVADQGMPEAAAQMGVVRLRGLDYRASEDADKFSGVQGMDADADDIPLDREMDADAYHPFSFQEMDADADGAFLVPQMNADAENWL